MSALVGPVFWIQPLFGDGAVPPIIIGRKTMSPTNSLSVETIESYDDERAEEQGVTVQAASGHRIPHELLERLGEALSLGEREIEVEIKQVSEIVRMFVKTASDLASAHELEIWLDRPAYDVWLGDGAQTTFGLTRRTAYGSTLVTFQQRPARCFVDLVELTMVTSGPAPGECLLSQVSDATQIVLGTAPTAAETVRFSYYPVLSVSAVKDSESLGERNDADLTLSFTESPPVRF